MNVGMGAFWEHTHGYFGLFFSFLKQNIGMIPCTGFAVCNEYGFLTRETKGEMGMKIVI